MNNLNLKKYKQTTPDQKLTSVFELIQQGIRFN